MSHIKNNFGFTIVETLVAISILSLAILGAFTAVQGSLQDSTIAKDRITAFYLAQEAMEYIKNVRDNNALSSVSGVSTHWLHSLSELSGDPCYFGNTCKIDVQQNAVTRCAGGFGSCTLLNQDSSTGLFGYTSGGTWSSTLFRREIQFSQVSSDDVLVTINMTWTTRGQAKSFQVTEELLNRE